MSKKLKILILTLLAVICTLAIGLFCACGGTTITGGDDGDGGNGGNGGNGGSKGDVVTAYADYWLSLPDFNVGARRTLTAGTRVLDLETVTAQFKVSVYLSDSENFRINSLPIEVSIPVELSFGVKENALKEHETYEYVDENYARCLALVVPEDLSEQVAAYIEQKFENVLANAGPIFISKYDGKQIKVVNFTDNTDYTSIPGLNKREDLPVDLNSLFELNENVQPVEITAKNLPTLVPYAYNDYKLFIFEPLNSLYGLDPRYYSYPSEEDFRLTYANDPSAPEMAGHGVFVDRKNYVIKVKKYGVNYKITYNFEIDDNSYYLKLESENGLLGTLGMADNELHAASDIISVSGWLYTAQRDMDWSGSSWQYHGYLYYESSKELSFDFKLDDVSAFEYNYRESPEHYQPSVKLSIAGIPDCELLSSTNFDLLLRLPEDINISVPDMKVNEIPEKFDSALFTFEYFGGGTVRTEYGELNKNYANMSSLLSQIKSKVAPNGEVSFDGEIRDSFNLGITFYYTVAFNLYDSDVDYAEFEDASALVTTFYEMQSFTYPSNLKIIEHYYTSYSAMETGRTSQRTVDIYDGFFDECRVDKLGTYSFPLVKENMMSPDRSAVYTYSVLDDVVTSLEVEFSLFFGGIIIDEPLDFTDCFITATYAHGQVRTVQLEESMLGSYSATTTGAQEIEIRFEEGITVEEFLVRKVKSFTFAEGLDNYYLLGDEPVFEVLLRVTFTDNDYDYIFAPAERFAGFDLSSLGSKTFSLTFGGVSRTHSYSVIDGVYLTYSETANGISIDSFNTGLPDEDATNVVVPEDIKNIVIPAEIDGKAVTALKKDLFKNLTILRSLVVPDSVTSVGYGIVDGCSNLKALTIPSHIQLKYYFTQYKEGSYLTSAVYPNIPKNLTVIISDTSTILADNFLEGLEGSSNEDNQISVLRFGKELTSLGTQEYNSLTRVGEFASHNENATIYVSDGVLYANGGKTLYFYPDNKKDKSFEIPEGVEEVVFMRRNNYIEELSIPASVATLGEDFMEICEELTSAVFASGSAVTHLPEGAFSYCEKLVTFVFPENLESIGALAMQRVAMDKIVLPSTVTEVGNQAFYDAKCTKLYIPTGATQSFVATSMNGRTTFKLNNLTELAYDGSVAIYTLCFMGDSFGRTAVKNVYITGEKSEIGSNWYSNGVNYNVQNVYVYGDTDFYQYYAFNGKTYIQKNGGAVPSKWW